MPLGTSKNFKTPATAHGTVAVGMVRGLPFPVPHPSILVVCLTYFRKTGEMYKYRMVFPIPTTDQLPPLCMVRCSSPCVMITSLWLLGQLFKRNNCRCDTYGLKRVVAVRHPQEKLRTGFMDFLGAALSAEKNSRTFPLHGGS